MRTPDGKWHQDELGTYFGSRPQVSIRSITQYRDRITGANLVFVGAFPYPPRKPVPNERNAMGVFSGVYDPQRLSYIRWTKAAEFQQQGQEERVMGFAECNGKLYCSTSSKIYERTDVPGGSGIGIEFVTKAELEKSVPLGYCIQSGGSGSQQRPDNR